MQMKVVFLESNLEKLRQKNLLTRTMYVPRSEIFLPYSQYMIYYESKLLAPVGCFSEFV